MINFQYQQQSGFDWAAFIIGYSHAFIKLHISSTCYLQFTPLTTEQMFYYNIIPWYGLKMCKLINEPIIVYEPAGSLPKAFIWRKRLYRISEIIGNYREPARWWKGEPLTHLIRVTASSRSESAFELMRVGNGWQITRIFD